MQRCGRPDISIYYTAFRQLSRSFFSPHELKVLRNRPRLRNRHWATLPIGIAYRQANHKPMATDRNDNTQFQTDAQYLNVAAFRVGSIEKASWNRLLKSLPTPCYSTVFVDSASEDRIRLISLKCGNVRIETGHAYLRSCAQSLT